MGCTNLDEIDFSNSIINHIPVKAFANCNSLTSIYFPNSLTSMSEYSFDGCEQLNMNGFNLAGIEIMSHIGDFDPFYAYNINHKYFNINARAFQNLYIKDGEQYATLTSYNIMPSAFIGTYLTSLNLSTSYSFIPENFASQSQLRNVELNGNSLTSINVSAFNLCYDLTSISLPESIQNIGDYAFNRCKSLTSIEFNNTTQQLNIGNKSFENATSLTRLKFNSVHININESNNPGWNNVVIVKIDGNLADFANEHGSDYDMESPDGWYIEDDVNELYENYAEYFFKDRNKHNVIFYFNDLTLEYGKIKIDGECFEFEDSMKTRLSSIAPLNPAGLEIPDFRTFLQNGLIPTSTEVIKSTTFNKMRDRYIPNLSGSLDIAYTRQIDANTLSCLNISAFYASSLLALNKNLLSGCSNLISVSIYSVHDIYEKAFCNCTALTSIGSANDLTSIGPSAFYNCRSLGNVANESWIKNIGERAFAKCSSLKSFSGTEQLTSLGNYAFQDCSSLTSIVVPPSIATIGTTLLGCTSLNHIELQHNIGSTATPSNSLKDCPNSLSVTFTGQSLHDVLASRSIASGTLTCSSEKFGSIKVRSTMYASDNAYQHPLVIAIDASNVAIVQNPAFIVEYAGSNNIRLVGIDSRYESSDSISYKQLKNIDEIVVDAFKGTVATQVIVGFSTLADVSTRFANNTFSTANAGSIRQIIVDSDAPSQDVWESFYSSILGSNDNIIVRFNNGYASGAYIVLDDDPFEFRFVGGIDTIIGVYDEKIQNTPIHIASINSKHKQLSSNAFTNSMAISSIATFSDVSAIYDYAFIYNGSVTEVSVKSNVVDMSIGAQAFANSSIRKATFSIPKANGSRFISSYGLNDNLALRELYYTNDVSAIGPSAFIDTRSNLTSIHFPATLDYLGDCAFAEFMDAFPQLRNINLYDCNKLLHINDYAFYNSIRELPDSTLVFNNALTSIGTAAFAYNKRCWVQTLSNMTQLGAENLQINTHLKEIGLSAFMYNHLRNVHFSDDLETISSYAFAYPKYKFPIHIKSKIEHIGENAFKDNIIKNPNNVIANIAAIDVQFNKLSSIFDVEVQPDYTAYNRAGFSDATVVSAAADADWLKSFAYVYDNKMHFCPQNLSIDLIHRTLVAVDKSSLTAYAPSYVSCIGPSAFTDCTLLEEVSAHESLSIGEYAFYNCSSLERIYSDYDDHDVPFHLSYPVNEATYYNCQKLDKILLLSSVPSIGPSAFYNCQMITSFFDDETISIKPLWSLSAIGDNAFEKCESLESFEIPKVLSSIGNDTFKDCLNLLNINIDLNSDDFVKITSRNDIADAVSSTFGSIQPSSSPTYGQTRINFLDVTYMNNGIVKIDDEFIRKRLYVDSGKDRIAISALEYSLFENAKQSYLNLSAISKIDQFVFANVKKLRSINILPSTDPSNIYCLEDIGDYAFSGCINLMSINGGVLSCKNIGCYAFNNCGMLLGMQVSFQTISSGSIGQGVFYGTSLNELDIIQCPYVGTGYPDTIESILDAFKTTIHYDIATNQNPLELPEYCLIYFKDESGKTIGKYDYMLHDIMHATIDINRNALTFIDKTTDSIKPLLLVKPIDGSLPAIAANTFHANVVGRWK